MRESIRRLLDPGSGLDGTIDAHVEYVSVTNASREFNHSYIVSLRVFRNR